MKASRILAAARRRVVQAAGYWSIRRKGIVFLRPNYIFFPPLPNKPIVDVGCGQDAEFARHFAEGGARVFAVDPTNKHKDRLQGFVARYPGKFNYVQRALAAERGQLEFFESELNESGSLLVNHRNVQRDPVKTYTVDAIDPPGLFDLVGGDVGLMKIDIEGAEFELFDRFSPADFTNVDQVFIEFHVEQISGKTPADVMKIVGAFEENGFRAHTMDWVNYLFVSEAFIAGGGR